MASCVIVPPFPQTLPLISSVVSNGERGEKRLSGAALKLLSLVEKNGLLRLHRRTGKHVVRLHAGAGTSNGRPLRAPLWRQKPAPGDRRTAVAAGTSACATSFLEGCLHGTF